MGLKQVFLKKVITGGQALLDTVSGLSQLVSQFPEDAQFVIWLNPYWGAIENEGCSFEQMKAYKDNSQESHEQGT